MTSTGHYLLDYYQKLLAASQHHYKQTLETGDEEAIHDLRVELKKIRALYFFLESLQPEFHAKRAFKSQKKLFKAVGRIRDFQVPNGLVKKYAKVLNTNVTGFHRFLNRGIAQSQSNFETWLAQADANLLDNARLGVTPNLKTISNQAMMVGGKTFIQSLFDEMEGLQGSRRADDWHQVRILLKRAHYVIDILEGFEPFYPAGKMKTIKLLEQLLGDWHDYVVTKEKLKEYLSSRKQTHHYDPFLKAFSKDQAHLIATSKIYLRKLL